MTNCKLELTTRQIKLPYLKSTELFTLFILGAIMSTKIAKFLTKEVQCKKAMLIVWVRGWSTNVSVKGDHSLVEPSRS